MLRPKITSVILSSLKPCGGIEPTRLVSRDSAFPLRGMFFH